MSVGRGCDEITREWFHAYIQGTRSRIGCADVCIVSIVWMFSQLLAYNSSQLCSSSSASMSATVTVSTGTINPPGHTGHRCICTRIVLTWCRRQEIPCSEQQTYCGHILF